MTNNINTVYLLLYCQDAEKSGSRCARRTETAAHKRRRAHYQVLRGSGHGVDGHHREHPRGHLRREVYRIFSHNNMIVANVCASSYINNNNNNNKNKKVYTSVCGTQERAGAMAAQAASALQSHRAAQDQRVQERDQRSHLRQVQGAQEVESDRHRVSFLLIICIVYTNNSVNNNKFKIQYDITKQNYGRTKRVPRQSQVSGDAEATDRSVLSGGDANSVHQHGAARPLHRHAHYRVRVTLLCASGLSRPLVHQGKQHHINTHAINHQSFNYICKFNNK